MESLYTPTNDLLDKYIDDFNNDPRYFPADQAIIKLFKAFPENKKLEDILLKISVINDLYSTNIFATFIMAKHIKNQDVDIKINSGDPDVVHQIASGHNIRRKKNNKEINFYSFATKYCNWHNRDGYAIYDRFVEKILMAYQRSDGFSSFTQSDLKHFRKFKQVIQDFIDYYSLTNHSLKEVDKFLWIYGKQVFPTNY